MYIQRYCWPAMNTKLNCLSSRRMGFPQSALFSHLGRVKEGTSSWMCAWWGCPSPCSDPEVYKEGLQLTLFSLDRQAVNLIEGPRTCAIWIRTLFRLWHHLHGLPLIGWTMFLSPQKACWNPRPYLEIESSPVQFSSVQFICSVVPYSLRPHGLQHARLPCPSPTPGAFSNSCPSSQWCHPTISSSVIPFSSHLRSFPASGSFPMSQFFA